MDNTMKILYNLFMMSLFSLILLGACSPSEDDIPEPTPKPDPDKATVSTTNLTSEAKEGTLSLSFTTNKAWTASSDQTWCKLSASSGSAGTASITLTLEANTTDQERTAKITITAGTELLFSSSTVPLHIPSEHFLSDLEVLTFALAMLLSA